jgi:tetratricopeptide (TPR) repeat protein
MSSIIEGYNYDIFISYRQKDNKGDRWVSEFVNALKTELESTFKEDISIYFDENPHDGLLETHDVDASLKEKLKCLIFIPIISRTYCDPRAFAWQHEFIAFIKMASADSFGLKVTLPNGNVAIRILPIRVHELGPEDTVLIENALGGALRGVDFIYKAPGVNRPLMHEEDHPKDNLNRTYYRDQINKVANAIDEVINGLKNGKSMPGKKHHGYQGISKSKKRLFGNIRSAFSLYGHKRKLIATFILLACIISALIIYRSVYLNKTENTFSFIRLTNLNNDSSLVNDAANFIESINEKINQIKSITVRPVFRDQYMDTKEPLNQIRKKLKSNYILDGNIRRDGKQIKIYIELTASRKNKVAWTKPIPYERNRSSEIAVETVKEIAREMGVIILPDEEKLITTEPSANPDANFTFTSANMILNDAWYYYNYGGKLLDSASFETAIESYDKIIKNYSGFALPYAKRAIARSFGFYLEQIDSSNIEKCKQDIDKALSLDKDLSEIDIAQGFYNYYCLQENEVALEFFRKASLKEPHSYKPLFYMALAARRLGKWDNCRRLLHQVVKLNPQEALFVTNIGMTYSFLHDFDSALYCQEKSIELIPNWAAGYKNKFETMILKDGLTRETKKLIDETIEKTGDKMTKYKMLVMLYERNYTQALAIALSADPDDFDIRAEKFIYLAMISNYLNNREKGLQYFEKALTLLNEDIIKYPGRSIFYALSGLANAGLGNKTKALEAAEKANKMAHKLNRMDESEMKMYLAEIYTLTGDYDDAYPLIVFLLNNPSFFSKKLLNLDPVWIPIVENPEYRKKLR